MAESQGQERIKRQGRQLQKRSDHFANDKSSNCRDFSGHFDENQTLPWLFQMRRLTIVVYNVHVHVTKPSFISCLSFLQNCSALLALSLATFHFLLHADGF